MPPSLLTTRVEALAISVVPSPVGDAAMGSSRGAPAVGSDKKKDLAGDLKVAGAQAMAAATAIAGAASTVAGALVTVGRFIGEKTRWVGNESHLSRKCFVI